MSRFTTRVELHDAGYGDYETLHAAMEAEGFSRTITSDDNDTYHLPTAEYDRSGELSCEQVLDSAKRAASKTRKRYAAIVTEARARMWVGLDKVTQHASRYYS